MKTTILFAVVAAMALITSACDDEKTHKTSRINKDGAVEIVYQTTHLNDSFDVLTTTKTVYKGGSSVKTIYTTDTLPALGTVTTEGENNSGDTRTFTTKREYGIFVTIK